MLRAPVLMRSIRRGHQSIRKNMRRISVSKQQREGRRDIGAPKRPTFKSVCGPATELSVAVTITDRRSKDDGYGIFYKDDEDRFTQRYTLKLKTSSVYDFRMDITPSLNIAYLKIAGIKYDTNMFKMKKEDAKTFINFLWSSKHIKTTSRKHRTVLPFVNKFRGYKELHFEVLVKFYESEETLHYTGLPLTSLGLYGTLSNDKQQKGQTYDIVYN